MVFSQITKSEIAHTFITRNGEAKLYRLTNEIITKEQPVLFIHGFNSSEKIWFSHRTKTNEYEGFAEKAVKDGYDVWILSLSKSKMANLIELAEDDLLTALMIIHTETDKKIKIIAHSMSGVLCRYLSHPIFFESVNLDIMETMVSEIVTLATPHSGFTIKQKSQNKLATIFEHFENWVSGKKKSPLYSGFFQFLSKSDLFITLNSNLYFNPGIKWVNAVAKHDFFILQSSILPIENLIGLEQKFFDVNHLKLPFYELMVRFVNKFGIKSKRLDFFISPPIYWSNEVYEWIFKSVS